MKFVRVPMKGSCCIKVQNKKKTSKGRFENLSFRRNNEKSDFLVSGVGVNLFEAVYG